MQEIQLLKAIEQDARISVTDLADILNSTPEQVDGGMKKLAEEKVICGYHTVINWDKTNQDHVMALIEVNASPERDCGYDKVAEKIYRYPEVSNMYLISGRSEFIVIVKGRTMREVADFVGQKPVSYTHLKADSFTGPTVDSVTSASIVQEAYIQDYTPCLLYTSTDRCVEDNFMIPQQPELFRSHHNCVFIQTFADHVVLPQQRVQRLIFHPFRFTIQLARPAVILNPRAEMHQSPGDDLARGSHAENADLQICQLQRDRLERCLAVTVKKADQLI